MKLSYVTRAIIDSLSFIGPLSFWPMVHYSFSSFSPDKKSKPGL